MLAKTGAPPYAHAHRHGEGCLRFRTSSEATKRGQRGKRGRQTSEPNGTGGSRNMISLHWLRRVRSATGALALIALAATLAAGFSQRWALTITSSVVLLTLVLLATVLDKPFFDSYERAKEVVDSPAFLADELLDTAEAFESDLSWGQVDVLLEGLLVPHNIRMRTRERIQPRTRTLFGEIRLDLNLPTSFLNARCSFPCAPTARGCCRISARSPRQGNRCGFSPTSSLPPCLSPSSGTAWRPPATTRPTAPASTKSTSRMWSLRSLRC